MTDTNKYLSKYSNGRMVSAAQYITELICENKAKIEKKDLHYRFWTNKTWAQYYRNQIASSNSLLEKYDAGAIISALKDPAASKIYSLRAPHLQSIIEKHQVLLKEKNNDFTLNVDRSKSTSYRANSPKNLNRLSKLKDIDNGN